MLFTTSLFTALICIMFLGSSALAFSEMRRESREQDGEGLPVNLNQN